MFVQQRLVKPPRSNIKRKYIASLQITSPYDIMLIALLDSYKEKHRLVSANELIICLKLNVHCDFHKYNDFVDTGRFVEDG